MIARAAIPATIGTLPRREALAFLSLFFVPGVAQAILLTVVPLEALYLLVQRFHETTPIKVHPARAWRLTEGPGQYEWFHGIAVLDCQRVFSRVSRSRC